MDEFIKLLDQNLDYISHEIIDGVCYIDVVSNRKEARCPFCGKLSSKKHSIYKRSFQDLPIQGNKVVIYLKTLKCFVIIRNVHILHLLNVLILFQIRGRKPRGLKTK